MNGVETKNICRNEAFQWADISQLFVWKSPPQSKKRVLLVCPNFEKDDATTSGKSIIHDIFILNLVFWRLWTILTLCSRLDCRIFLIIWFTTPPSQAWTRAYKSFEDYCLFDDRWLRIVTIRSLVALRVKSNVEKVNYQSDPESLTVKAGESRKKQPETIFYMLVNTVFVSLFFIKNNSCLQETSLQVNPFYD